MAEAYFHVKIRDHAMVVAVAEWCEHHRDVLSEDARIEFANIFKGDKADMIQGEIMIFNEGRVAALHTWVDRHSDQLSQGSRFDLLHIFEGD